MPSGCSVLFVVYSVLASSVAEIDLYQIGEASCPRNDGSFWKSKFEFPISKRKSGQTAQKGWISFETWICMGNLAVICLYAADDTGRDCRGRSVADHAQADNRLSG